MIDAPNPKLIPNYVTGIQAAKAKMVARVGQAEADRWERNAINSAARMEQAYDEARREGRVQSPGDKLDAVTPVSDDGDYHVRGGQAGSKAQRSAVSEAEQRQWGRKAAFQTWGGEPPVTCELCGAVLYYWPKAANPPGDPLDEAAEAIADHLKYDHQLSISSSH